MRDPISTIHCKDTALVCSGQETCVVHGSAGVWVAEISGTSDCSLYSDDHCAFTGVKTSYITRDDILNMTSWTVQLADWKQELVEDELVSAEQSEDIFSVETKDEFVRVVNSLLESGDNVTWSRTLETSPVQYEVQFMKDRFVTRAVNDTETGLISYENLFLDLYPSY